MTKFLERLREMVLGERCGDSNGTAPALHLKVRCARCGEEIVTRIEKAHGLQEQYEAAKRGVEGEPRVSGYLLQKELLGSQCQTLITLALHFDAGKRPLEHEIEGGTLLEVSDSD